jgi:thioredoxin-related protein
MLRSRLGMYVLSAYVIQFFLIVCFRNSSTEVTLPTDLVLRSSVRTSQETHYVSATQPNRLMLFRKTVAVYRENHTEHTDTVRTSQETHYVCSTETNRLMPFGKTATVYCENHTEHTDTLRTSQETHYVSATETNRLMLFGETVAVYCENHTEHK